MTSLLKTSKKSETGPQNSQSSSNYQSSNHQSSRVIQINRNSFEDSLSGILRPKSSSSMDVSDSPTQISSSPETLIPSSSSPLKYSTEDLNLLNPNREIKNLISSELSTFKRQIIQEFENFRININQEFEDLKTEISKLRLSESKQSKIVEKSSFEEIPQYHSPYFDVQSNENVSILSSRSFTLEIKNQVFKEAGDFILHPFGDSKVENLIIGTIQLEFFVEEEGIHESLYFNSQIQDGVYIFRPTERTIGIFKNHLGKTFCLKHGC